MTNREYTHILNKVTPTIYFDQTNYLRETASDLGLLEESIKALEYSLIKEESEGAYYLSGALGNLYRIYGNADKVHLHKAKEYLQLCLNYALEHQDIVKEIITLIRIGEVYKYDDQHRQALVLFEKALSLCEKNGVDHYVDFVLQHIGKCYMEMNQLEYAEKYLRQALALRQQKGDKALIASTLEAMELLVQLKKS
ncbi:tetratricopeptide repeat protein [Gracilibacillus sp. S3-1-1]|uniref:Tetratricopeptide repeat protein n=1 Tax=Gracilibacillus pellucidus TaxID=3095368 RepID=A0ACC6M6J2_9BACI|nr:tetratricopeptide repeat protein [Gracilibacillus sp. S3-1-1]MDX8046516.1 tetratricopeptide repeat protein [Gracilibacillus sp. S3-1-1]